MSEEEKYNYLADIQDKVDDLMYIIERRKELDEINKKFNTHKPFSLNTCNCPNCR